MRAVCDMPLVDSEGDCFLENQHLKAARKFKEYTATIKTKEQALKLLEDSGIMALHKHIEEEKQNDC